MGTKASRQLFNIESLGHDYSIDVTKLWENIKHTQTVNSVTPTDPLSPKPEGHTRFVCVSDTHSLTKDMRFMPEGDVLIHAGDFSNVGMKHDIVEFNQWLKDQPFQHKVVIAGNHDVSFDVASYNPELYENFQKRRGLKEPYDPLEIKALLKDCTYLEDEATNINGFDIYGSPWQPEFYAWGFNLPRNELLQAKWKAIPDKCDILVSFLLCIFQDRKII